jgi:hypothetical protein
MQRVGLRASLIYKTAFLLHQKKGPEVGARRQIALPDGKKSGD